MKFAAHLSAAVIIPLALSACDRTPATVADANASSAAEPVVEQTADAVAAPVVENSTGQANLSLNASESRLSFVSVKNNSVGEVHRFDRFDGQLIEGQSLTLNIDLNSVNTGIEIRDDRMREHLFDTANYSTATVTAELGAYNTAVLGTGQSLRESVAFELDLHGAKHGLKAEVVITRLADGALLVQSLSPILLDAGRYEFVAGLAKLQELAGLTAINSSVPVSFNLRFQ